MFQRYTKVDDNKLDYLKSEHAMALQDSQYVKIDDNRERIFWQKYYANKLDGMQNSGSNGALLQNQKLNMRFVCEQEVLKK